MPDPFHQALRRWLRRCMERRNVGSADLALTEHVLSFRFFTRSRVSVAQECQHQRAAGKLHTFLKLKDCFGIHALLLVSEATISQRRKEVGVEVQNPAALLDRSFILAGQVHDPTQMRTRDKREWFEPLS